MPDAPKLTVRNKARRIPAEHTSAIQLPHSARTAEALVTRAVSSRANRRLRDYVRHSNQSSILALNPVSQLCCESAVRQSVIQRTVAKPPRSLPSHINYTPAAKYTSHWTSIVGPPFVARPAGSPNTKISPSLAQLTSDSAPSYHGTLRRHAGTQLYGLAVLHAWLLVASLASCRAG